MRSVALNILTILGLLTSGSGCQVLGIPSYRADVGCGGCATPGYPETVFTGDSTVYCPPSAACDAAYTECPSGILPPLPACLANWRAKRDKPPAPPYPRFHPLPTRPVFSPQPAHIPSESLVDPDYGHSPLGQPQGYGHFSEVGGRPAGSLP